MFWHDTSCHVALCHLFSRRLVLCHVMPVVLASLLASSACHLSLCHVPSGHATSCPVISSRVLYCPVISCLVASSRVTSCHAMLCHHFSCHALRCQIMLCYVMSCLDAAVASCLGTGPLMCGVIFHASRLVTSSCVVACLVLYACALSFYSCHVMPCRLFSSHVM